MYTITELQKLINEELKVRSTELKKTNPVDLYSPVNYSLDMGGKRLRPVLVLLSYNMFSETVREALPAAIAIEVFHNFTLLHDDIMDNADVRRNRPTVHKKFSENSAILSGDVMAFIAYRYLYECKAEQLNEVCNLFTNTAIEVCEGQQYDMEFENRMDVTEEEYLEMIRLKTAVLLACSLKSGALLVNADKKITGQLYDFGINLGLAFQLQDDLLDSFGDPDSFGKKIGGDILANKKTFLSINALQQATGETKNELLNWFSNTELNPEEKIKSVLEIYKKLNIRSFTEQKIELYFNKCNQILDEIEIDYERKSQLKEISKLMLKRVS
ncbi:polyprenyl synthetase family protein [uncultured Draconibacterium sp.]|uniref:polyprenyl synthetase family protein n=1 Tax=uncultured Draconibacterium sp. TaxID=1573823 RepID=UPI0025FA4E00|nr:polyprenyl synthetase family protein [uncultured Draconibacterium sp.]